MKRVLFLFGAGASYGSGDRTIRPHPPPLGDSLFAALCAEYPHTWGAISAETQAVFKKPGGFENGMQLILEGKEQPFALYNIDMAHYFTRFGLCDPSNCYVRLLHFLIVSRIIEHATFATLNYECLLEEAICSLGLLVTYQLAPVTEPPSPNKLVVIKVHGSCNLMVRPRRVTLTGLIASPQYGSSAVEGDVEVHVLTPNEARQRLASREDSLPLIATYARGKHTASNTRLGRALTLAWGQAGYSTDVLVLIGVNPTPDDRHIWETVVDSKAKVLFLGSRRGQHYLEFERRLSAQARLEWVGEYFVPSLSTLTEALFKHCTY
jgi:hypothetical protein